MQRTFSEKLTIQGIGLHSGCQSTLTLCPAPANHGIVFRRFDLPAKPEFPALYNHVIDTRNCTCLGDAAGNRVSTTEHLMAALYAAGIDNALIEIDNQEIPIMDSSAQEFFRRFTSTPLKQQKAPRKYLKVLKEVSYQDENGASVVLRPAEKGLKIHYEINFPSPIVGHQIFESEITPEVFEKEIAPCRTFAEKFQIDYLLSLGLIKGGSLENAVVLDGDKILNPEGFRMQNECVNHKVLDAAGDLYTSGYYIIGALTADRSGHRHNNELLKNLFADSANYSII